MTAEEELDAWREWRSRCAFDLLDARPREGLREVVAQRFRWRVRKLSASGIWSGTTPDLPSDRECAHLFEAHLQLHHRRDGKSYKHWLLTRGRQDLDTVQSGVMLLIRNVVKQWVNDVHPRTAPLSLQEAFGCDLTLEQCLPGETTGEVTPLQNWVQEQETAWMMELCTEEKRMLAIRARGWVFSGSRALAVAGMGKTKLHQLHREVMTRWAESLREAQPGVDPVEASRAVLDTMDRAGEIFSHLLAEKPDSAAFRDTKDSHGN